MIHSPRDSKLFFISNLQQSGLFTWCPDKVGHCVTLLPSLIHVTLGGGGGGGGGVGLGAVIILHSATNMLMFSIVL